MADPQPKKILVLGGGFAGLEFCKKFRHPNVRIQLVDRKNHHLFQPLLYQVAASGLSGPQIAQPLRAMFRDRPDVETYLDKIEELSLPDRTAKGRNRVYEYDYLVLAAGAHTSFFGNNHWAEHVHGLKTLNDALTLRSHVLSRVEQAEIELDENRRRQLMTFLVVGGGPTGVEMAGALAELGRHVMKRNFRNIDPGDIRVILIEGSDRILGNYAQSLSAKATRQIQELGVEVRCGNMVQDVRPQELDVGGETLHAATIVWGAGVEAIPLTRSLGVPVDRAGRIKVEPDCSIPGYPEAFALGDLANLVDAKGKPVPGVSPAAMQMARHAAKIIRMELKTGKTRSPRKRNPFVYFDKGKMATIGRSRAIAEVGKLRMAGFPAWIAWLLVHLIFLVGFRNKVLVLFDWFYSYATYRRGARVIID